MSIAGLLTRGSKVIVLALLLTAGIAFAQDEVAAAPPLSIQPGTFLTVRINDAVSSDRNQVGDVFSASLSQPLIVQGIIVAHRGQTVGGRVVEARKAGMVAGVSRLGIALTSLTLVDGQNVPLRTQLLVRNGRAEVGRDVSTVAGATGVGAAIGAIAGRGRGAAIGAGAGAAAGTLDVLLTRGYPTIIYPESMLTFQVLEPVSIDASNAPQAFRAVNSEDYQRTEAQLQYQPAPTSAVGPQVIPPPPVAYPYPYYVYGQPYDPYYYPYYARPYYYGPAVNLSFGYPAYRYRPYYGRVYRPGPVVYRHVGPAPYRRVPSHDRVVVHDRHR